jgi:hypothetical protein
MLPAPCGVAAATDDFGTPLPGPRGRFRFLNIGLGEPSAVGAES